MCDVDENQVRPPTPPPRHEAYEQFKRSRGKELNKIFLTNKGWHNLCVSYNGVQCLYVMCVVGCRVSSEEEESFD